MIRQHVAAHWRPGVAQFAALTAGAFFLLLGGPILLDALPPPWPDIPLSWQAPAIWPLEVLTEGPLGTAYVLAGLLLWADAWRPWGRRWQRLLVWGYGWLVLTNLWLYVCAAMVTAPRLPGGLWAAETALWVGYTLAWLAGRPLEGGAEDA